MLEHPFSSADGLFRNQQAAWGFQPKGHPCSKTYTPRTILQKRQAACKVLKDCPEGRKRSDPNFTSDEPLSAVIESSRLDFPKKKNDLIEIDNSFHTNETTARRKHLNINDGQVFDTSKSRLPANQTRRHHKRPQTASEVRQSIGLVDMTVNPPKLNDVRKDLGRMRRLRSAKTAWTNAERLLCMNANPMEIDKEFQIARGHFTNVQQITPRDNERWPYVRAVSCTRFV